MIYIYILPCSLGPQTHVEKLSFSLEFNSAATVQDSEDAGLHGGDKLI